MENINNKNNLLKFITCGSVDDGKSTLIGHMLYKAKLIFKDQEDALILESKIKNNNVIDYSLLLDGLTAEREQGITIDVAYRYFNTRERSFIVADTPGHEEYTRNMAVGASFVDLAIILLDASNIKDDILTQTKRHIRICNLMGIENYVFAVNKMDLVEYSQIKFCEISEYISKFLEASSVEYNNKFIIPISATRGDNIIELSDNMSWYKDKALLEYLENIDIKNNKNNKNQDFLMAVQRVSRPDQNFRGFQGQISEGSVEVGEEITILPSGEKANVKKIYILDKEAKRVEKGRAVTIALDKEVDCSRGCVIVKNNKNINNTRLFKADLLWTDNDNLVVGREYLIKIGTKLVSGMIININYCVDINTGASISQKDAKKNDIINCDVSLIEKVVTSSFEDCKDLGRFVLINKLNNMTSGCGV
ncbi:MAG: GTP-binding protein, partial [bacterium]